MGTRGVVAAGLAAACLLAAIWAVVLNRPQPPSSYSATGTGLKALYLVLKQEGVPVGRRTGPRLPGSGLLVGAAGPAPISRAAVDRLLAWIRAGHEAILLGNIPALGRALNVTPAIDRFAGSPARAALPLPELRRAGTVRMPEAVLLVPHRHATVLYELGGAPAGLELTPGRGRLYWFGSPAMWSNAILARYPENLALAENLLNRGRPVWFDEYWFGRGLVPEVPRAVGRSAPPLPLPRGSDVAAAALAAAAAAAVWAAGWRRHPVRPEQSPSPSAPEVLRARAELRFRTDGGKRGNA